MASGTDGISRRIKLDCNWPLDRRLRASVCRWFYDEEEFSASGVVTPEDTALWVLPEHILSVRSRGYVHPPGGEKVLFRALILEGLPVQGNDTARKPTIYVVPDTPENRAALGMDASD